MKTEFFVPVFVAKKANTFVSYERTLSSYFLDVNYLVKNQNAFVFGYRQKAIHIGSDQDVFRPQLRIDERIHLQCESFLHYFDCLINLTMFFIKIKRYEMLLIELKC